MIIVSNLSVAHIMLSQKEDNEQNEQNEQNGQNEQSLEERNADLIIHLMCDLADTTKPFDIFYKYWSDYPDQRNTIYNYLHSQIFEIPTKEILSCINNFSDCTIMLDGWLTYIKLSPQENYEFLNRLMQDDGIDLYIIKKIWSIQQFRNAISYIPKIKNGKEYEQKHPLFSPFTKLVKNPIHYSCIIDILVPLIKDESIHESLVTLLWSIIHANELYISINPYASINCSSLNFNNFVLYLLTQLISYYTIDTIVEKIILTNQSYIIKDYDILSVNVDSEYKSGLEEEIKSDSYLEITSSNLPLPHKLYVTGLYAISVCHTNLFKQYKKLQSQGRFVMLFNNASRSNLTQILKAYDIFFSDTVDATMFLKANVQQLYISYEKIHSKLKISQAMNDIVDYIVSVNQFQNYELYGSLPKELLILLSNIMGGQFKKLTSPHCRYSANECIYHLISNHGLAAFGNIFINLSNYITDVNFFKTDTPEILQAITHHKHTIEMLRFILDNPIKNVASQSVMAGTIFNVLKRDIKILEYIMELNKFQMSYDIIDLIMEMFDIIILSLVIYKQFYTNNVVTINFKEVDTKYIVVIQTILQQISSPTCILTTKLDRSDLVYDILQIIFDTICLRIDNMVAAFDEIKQVIIENVDKLRESDRNMMKERLDIMLDKLSKFKDDKLEFPDEFIDPFMCTEITEPIMIPDNNQIYDKTSILMQIRETGLHPITRKPFTEDEMIKFNEKDNVKIKLQEFMMAKNAWIESMHENKENIKNDVLQIKNDDQQIKNANPQIKNE